MYVGGCFAYVLLQDFIVSGLTFRSLIHFEFIFVYGQGIIFKVLFESISQGFPGGSDDKESSCNAGDPSSIPGLGRSPGEGNGNPLQYSCLRNLMDGDADQAISHEVAKSCARLSNFTKGSFKFRFKSRKMPHHYHLTFVKYLQPQTFSYRLPTGMPGKGAFLNRLYVQCRSLNHSRHLDGQDRK